MKKFYCIIILFVGAHLSVYGQSAQRYIASEFTEVQTHFNQVYVTAPQLSSPYLGESLTSNVDLKMHVFKPQGDNLQSRPLLICFHGGGFVSGTKEHDDMMEFCKIFARKGYVTVTAQYRLGMNLFSNTSGERAVYRAIQDSRALIRYFRENAAAYKISPNHIYLIGSSAGAFIALHNIFMDKETERPAGTYAINNLPPTTDNRPDLGDLDAIGSFKTHSSQANGIVALWGALKHTDIIEAGDKNIPVFLVHGTADLIVPFGLGSPFQAPILAQTYGSQLIDQRLTQLNFSHETYFVQGEGHEFYGVLNGNWSPAPNQYWTIVVDKTRDFLFSMHKPTAVFTNTISGDRVTFTNTSVNAVAWQWDFGDGETSSEKDPVHIYKQSGNYAVKLTAFSSIYSAHSFISNVNVTVVGVENDLTIPKEFSLSQNYPNPFNPTTTIQFAIPNSQFVILKVFDVLGREIATPVNEELNPGEHSVVYDANGLVSGVYFYCLNTPTFSQTKSMTVIK